MPNDVITLHALAKELNEFLSGGRIEKIYQPEKDEITLTVRNNGSVHNLVISAHPSQPRMHITTEKKENAYNAPAFCMLLRKYLHSGIITAIQLLNCDRVIQLAVDARNELLDTASYFILAELVGRQSNIILVDHEYKIVDAIKRVHLEQNAKRFILPNLTYPVLTQPKIRLDNDSALKEFFAVHKNLTQDILMQNIGGISKETAKEIATACDGATRLSEFYNIYESKQYDPCILLSGDTVTDYFILPYKSITGSYKKLPTLNQCFDYFYLIHDQFERKRAHTKRLNQLLKRLQSKNSNRIKYSLQKIKDSAKAEKINQMGQLALANIYSMKQGDKSVVCYDYYNDTQVEIELDIMLSPSQNVQKYFKKSAKLKRAKEIAEKQLAELYIQKEYLESIATSIENSQTKQEFAEILQELQKLSGIKDKQQTKKKATASQPLHINIDGYDVFIGKNSLQNVQVTFSIGASNDVWLHAKNYHGSHVIIKGDPSMDVIAKASSYAAYFSGGRANSKVEVDYTLRKHVKKIAHAYTGLVTYTNHKTVVVTPTSPQTL